MRLKKIKLAGFKSFVDPLSLELSSSLTAVVGPNGCGKSNIIDAIRWVMGESSAKNLRGESMSDVIFNGSSTRKPVGQAMVELVFDNTKGLGGEYAKFSEISVRRHGTRDGQSNYFLNNVRCRRKDITDLFLGTGLGPRSYSIIQQGMISRLIEAKPEEMRGFLEEAAGVSLYRKRRAETENRMRHTRENLDRLNDIQQELEKQLDRLKRQSQAAQRYHEYKSERDQLEAELCVLQWQELSGELEAKSSAIQQFSTRLEEKLAERASLDLDLEKTRVTYTEKTDSWKVLQSAFYDLGTQIARLEQSLEHHREREQTLREDKAELERHDQDLLSQLQKDEQQKASLAEELSQLLPELERILALAEDADKVLIDVKENMEKWAERFDGFQQEAEKPKQTAEVERVRIEQFEKQSVEATRALEKLELERSTIDIAGLEQQLAELEVELVDIETQGSHSSTQFTRLSEALSESREDLLVKTKTLDELKDQRQTLKGQLVSLEALQQAALGKTNSVVSAWLEHKGLIELPRLGEQISVEPGYERAVETVLGSALEAVCVSDMQAITDYIGELEEGDVSFIEASQNLGIQQSDWLAAKVRTELPIDSLLSHVFVVDTLAEALARQKQLNSQESVVTRDGIWLGRHWLRVYRSDQGHRGVLSREAEMKTVNASLEEFSQQVADCEENIRKQRDNIAELEAQREQLRQDQQLHAESLKALSSKISAKRANLEHLRNELARLEGAVYEHKQKIETANTEAGLARVRLEEAFDQMQEHEQKRQALRREQESLRDLLQEATDKQRQSKQSAHDYQLKQQTVLTQQRAIDEGLLRLRQQHDTLVERRQTLEAQLEKITEPQQGLREELDQLLGEQMRSEKELNAAREQLAEIEQLLQAHEKRRHALEEEAQDIRSEVESARLDWQAVQTRSQTVLEKLQEMNATLEDIQQNLAAEASEKEWKERFEAIVKRIDRLGPINLGAVEEYNSEMERKEYLDSQRQDLMEALETLENAIRKIDRETRTRFKETFDQVNESFQVLFPRLFGGGQAYLELVGEDLLESGITVMARPPGKRNSSIHLLSGGEKALSAVALVFSIFQLNPAPFCMLDEVDAPLDDANIGRFCDLVKSLSDSVQFIFVTHNKLAVEIAHHLVGVTMKEPGVSRLVSVDIDEAVALVE